jgi:hypothetical protein
MLAFRSPSISRAKCASNAVSFLVLTGVDREFIMAKTEMLALILPVRPPPSSSMVV